MNHLGTKRMETERLILRPFAMSDADAMFRNWASDPEATKYLTWPAHQSSGVTSRILSDWTSHYEEPDYYQWAIVPKNLGQPIGSISVVSRNDEAQSVHIGYCIGKNWWHRGYTSEALEALIGFFFREVGVNRIDSRHDPRNPYSGAVMEKCGLRREGILRQADRNNQGICDAVWYGILREEYEC